MPLKFLVLRTAHCRDNYSELPFVCEEDMHGTNESSTKTNVKSKPTETTTEATKTNTNLISNFLNMLKKRAQAEEKKPGKGKSVSSLF